MSPAIRQITALIVFVLVCLGIGFISSMFTTPSIPGWYAGLNKPSWTPPNWVFGPVWTILYILMGISAWLIWRKYGFSGASLAFGLFAVQLLFNFSWSMIFFGQHQITAALVCIIILWFLILATTIVFWRLLPIAGILLLPYLIWVGYATTLNFGIWRMNL